MPAEIEWTEELIAEFCGDIASGSAIADVAGKNGYPSERSIYRRMSTDEAFGRAIARAREAQQDAEAEKIIRMADDATAEDWQVVKLRIWARQWRAAKLAPKKYGDKQEVTVAMSDDAAAAFIAARKRVSSDA